MSGAALGPADQGSVVGVGRKLSQFDHHSNDASTPGVVGAQAPNKRRKQVVYGTCSVCDEHESKTFKSADVGERIVLSFLYGSITRSMGGHVMLCCACSRALDSNERQGFKSSTKTPLVEQCASIVMAAPAFACTGTVVKVPVTRPAMRNLMLSHSRSENGIDVLDSYLLKLSTTPPDWIIFRHFPGCIVSIANW